MTKTFTATAVARFLIATLCILRPAAGGAPSNATDVTGRPLHDAGVELNYAPAPPGRAPSRGRLIIDREPVGIAAASAVGRMLPRDRASAVDPMLMRDDATVGTYNQQLGTTGIHAVDTDADGIPEIVVGHTMMWYLLEWRAETLEFVQRYFYATGRGAVFGGGGIVELEVGDVDGDGELEVAVLFEDGSVSTYDARTGVVEQQVSLAVASAEGLELGELDPLPGLELAIRDGSVVEVYNLSSATPLWAVATSGGALAIGNVDGDPALEIVAAGGDVIDVATQLVEWTYPTAFGVYVDTGDVDGDLIEEIVAADGWGWFRAIDGDTRTAKWEVENFDNSAILAADYDGDGVAEVFLGDGQWGDVRMIHGLTGSEIATIRNPEHSVANIALGDVDGDCVLEVLWGAGYSSTGADHIYSGDLGTGLIEWQNVESDGPIYSLAVDDLDADGRMEMLHISLESDAGYESALAFVTDLHHRRFEYADQSQFNRSWLAERGVAVAQLDADPQLEWIIHDTQIRDPKLSAFDALSRAREWTSPVFEYSEDVLSIAAGDVDANSTIDVVVGTELRVHILDGSDGSLVFTTLTTHTAADLRLADLDGDSAVEIVFADLGRGARVLDGGSRAEEWFQPLSAISALDVGDVDSDLDLDLIFGTDDGSLFAYDGQSRALLFGESIGSDRINSILVADLDGDLVNEIIIGQQLDSDFSVVRVVRAVDRALLWESGPLVGAAGTGSAMHVGDIDDDGRIEIAIATSYAVRVFEYADGGADATVPVWPATIGLQMAESIVSPTCCPSVDLGWQEADDAASPPIGYRVYRDPTSGFVPGPANLVGRTGLRSYRDSQVSPNTQYYYVVRAHDTAGNEDLNTVELGILTPDSVPPDEAAIGSVVDPDACDQGGVDISFGYPGDPARVTFGLVVDGTVVQSGVTSPVHWDPGDVLSHEYRIQVVKNDCPLVSLSAPVDASDAGDVLAAATVVSVADVDICATDGVDVSFTHPGFDTSGQYDLLVDGSVVATDVVSPVNWVPPDALSHDYVIRAVEFGCARAIDSAERSGVDENRIPDAPVITRIDDLDPCAVSSALLNFTHPGFPEAGHHELWRDGSLYLSPVFDGSVFPPGDALPHDYIVRAVDDLCGLSTDSAVTVHADAVGCNSLGEPRLYMVRDGSDIRAEWEPASGPVATYNLYPGDMAELRASGEYSHQKTLAGATFPDSPDPATGCDVASGPGTMAGLAGVSGSGDLYFILVAADSLGQEGPYGARNGIDRHDPVLDPRPPVFFCP